MSEELLRGRVLPHTILYATDPMYNDDEEFFEDPIYDFYDFINPELYLSMQNQTSFKELTMAAFFTSHRVDVPRPFKSAVPKRKYVKSTFHLKIINMVMHHGLKRTARVGYSNALRTIQADHYSKEVKDSQLCHWRVLYNAFSKLCVHSPGSDFRSWTTRTLNSDDLLVFGQSKHFGSSYHINMLEIDKTFLRKSLEEYLPLFNFYVKKVDKLRRKHSRGKTGRYEIVWKYVPKYRRFYVLLRWLLRDIRNQKFRTLDERFARSLETLVLNKNKHLISQLRKYVHKFVFENMRNTLLNSLRATR